MPSPKECQPSAIRHLLQIRKVEMLNRNHHLRKNVHIYLFMLMYLKKATVKLVFFKQTENSTSSVITQAP